MQSNLLSRAKNFNAVRALGQAYSSSKKINVFRGSNFLYGVKRFILVIMVSISKSSSKILVYEGFSTKLSSTTFS